MRNGEKVMYFKSLGHTKTDRVWGEYRTGLLHDFSPDML
jgi:hypothetical protein